MYDLIIREGRLFDGTRSECHAAVMGLDRTTNDWSLPTEKELDRWSLTFECENDLILRSTPTVNEPLITMMSFLASGSRFFKCRKSIPVPVGGS